MWSLYGVGSLVRPTDCSDLFFVSLFSSEAYFIKGSERWKKNIFSEKEQNEHKYSVCLSGQHN